MLAFTDRWGFSATERLKLELPPNTTTLEHKARELSELVVYVCVVYPEEIGTAIAAGLTDKMVRPPVVWRWLVSQQGKAELDMHALWRELAGMELGERYKVIGGLAECSHPEQRFGACRLNFAAKCRELVQCWHSLKLEQAHDALVIALKRQEVDEIAAARRGIADAQAAWDAVQTPEPGWKDAVVEVVKDTEGARPLMVETGLAEHDAHIGGGFGAGWLVVIMAPPKAGKTALAVSTIAAHSLSQGGRVALVSLEMPRSQVIQRLLARESGVPVRAMNARDLTSTQRSILSGAADRVASWDLTVLSSSTMVDIAARLRVLHKAKPLTMAVVDYAQLVDNGLRDRREDIEATTRGTKLLAMELGIPILLLAQPNNTDAKDGTVGFFSGKGTGAIAADCDLMLIPSRAKEDPSSAGLEIAGGRHAEPRKWELGSLAFDGARMLFSERLVRR